MNIAIFIDGQNVNVKTWIRFRKQMSSLLKVGDDKIFIVKENVYCSLNSDWVGFYNSNNTSNFNLRIIKTKNGKGSNGADVELTWDLADLVIKKEVRIDYIVILTNDSDFSALYKTLHERGIKLFVATNRAIGLKECSDEFFLFEEDKKEEDLKSKTVANENVDKNKILETRVDAYLVKIDKDKDNLSDEQKMILTIMLNYCKEKNKFKFGSSEISKIIKEKLGNEKLQRPLQKIKEFSKIFILENNSCRLNNEIKISNFKNENIFTKNSKATDIKQELLNKANKIENQDDKNLVLVAIKCFENYNEKINGGILAGRINEMYKNLKTKAPTMPIKKLKKYSDIFKVEKDGVSLTIRKTKPETKPEQNEFTIKKKTKMQEYMLKIDDMIKDVVDNEKYTIHERGIVAEILEVIKNDFYNDTVKNLNNVIILFICQIWMF